MMLPHAQLAIVEREKVVDYLLEAAHPDNGGKAAFFSAMGFTRREWHILAEALRRHALNTVVTRELESVHGCKYVLEGPMDTPCGKAPRIRSVWIIDQGSPTPRLVTAYPYE